MRLYSLGDEENTRQYDWEAGDTQWVFAGNGVVRLMFLFTYICGRLRYHPRTLGRKIVEMQERDGVLTIIWESEPHLNERRAADDGWMALGTAESIVHQARTYGR